MLCSEDGKPELAFHCYHMLHLTNPNKFKTNSDLAIETNVQPGKTVNSAFDMKTTINDVLEAIS